MDIENVETLEKETVLEGGVAPDPKGKVSGSRLSVLHPLEHTSAPHQRCASCASFAITCAIH
jgi:hypothetical protein